ncbi:DNA utilization protein GntX [Rouxiella sp. S1S-2]|uniref:DNA utilization protein GntX n=1 Tax=Rouxiella sp. S1S-2 TaxID=2653856 RepID=UPI001264AEFB|nr:DNA utilization protein GntX [Rouxiella sp. S1S-2]KAB7894922.1 DNA utilization protein GntX [Rouxiella sp. S1S-2]
MLTIASRCWLCQQPLQLARHGICSLCIKHLPALPCCCPRCGLPGSNARLPCGRCILKPPLWQSLIFASVYQLPISTLLLRFKFSSTPELAEPLARLLLLQWLARWRTGSVARPEVLLSIPLHLRRYRHRGYNQSELLARPLARWLGCDYQPYALERDRATVPQQQLSEPERKRNLRQAFSCNSALTGKHVALIDDVVTTGSTISEVSKLLNKNDIASLQIWCICRTL